MKGEKFDYYIFIDYSENLIGYIIIEDSKVNELIKKISRFRHYRESKNRKLYIKKVKITFKKENLLNLFLKKKIRNVLETPEIFSDIAEFLKKNNDSSIFISVDDRQYSTFKKLVKIIDGAKTKVIKESGLRKNTPEYRINLVLDTWLNIERIKDKLPISIIPVAIWSCQIRNLYPCKFIAVR